MTVVFRFTPDPQELRDISTDPMLADAGDLDLILLRQEVDLIIDDVPILTRHSIPLFFLTFWGLQQLRKLPTLRVVTFDIPEGPCQLRLEMQDGQVFVAERFKGASAAVDYSELLTAWEQFANDAKSYLLSEFPQLARHPEVGSWFDE